MARPNPVLILPDPFFTGRANLVSATSEANPYASMPVSGLTNEGDLLPTCYAHEVTAEYDNTIAIVRAGGPYRTAEWRWKVTDEADSTYRGVDQINWLSLPHDPYAGIGGFRNVLASCFAKRLNKIFLYWINGSGQFLVRYRTAGASPTQWTSASFTVERPVVSVALGGLEVLEMPDGSLRMLVVYGVAGATNNDVDVYSSINGLAWTLASRSVISKQTGATYDIQRIRAAVSGDWIRLLVMVVGTTYAFVSSDRGASFKQLSNLAVAVPTNGQTADPYGGVDIEGVDDAAGTFVMVRAQTASPVAQFSTASRDQDWSAEAIMTTVSRNIYRVCLARTATHMVAFFVTSDGGANARQFEGFYVAVDEATDSAQWRLADWQGGMGVDSAQYMARSVTAVEADSGFLIMFGLCDSASSGAEVETGGLIYGQPWTARSFWADETVPSTTAVPQGVDILWDTLCGSPAGWSGTLWIATNGASSSETWSSDYWRAQSDATGTTGRRKLEYDAGAAPSSKWADGGKLGTEWILKCTTVAPGAIDGDRVAVRVRALGATAGVSLDFSVRHSNNKILAYDNAAAQTVATLSGLDLDTAFYVVRAAITMHDSARWVEIAAAKTDNLSAWSVATGTLSAVAVITSQNIQWGHVVGLAGVTSDWRRFAVDFNNDWHQGGFASPTSLRGAPVSARAWWMSDGVWVDWGGGAAFEQDYWRAQPRHRYEVDNLFLPSPRAPWRSTSLVSNQLIWRASEDSNSRPRQFNHTAFSMFGANVRKLKVAYDSSISFTSPITSFWLYSDLVSGITVSTVGDGFIDVAGATLEPGAHLGNWFHFTSGALSGASVTISQQAGNRLYFDPLGWTSVAAATSDALVIHGSVLGTLYTSAVRSKFLLLECSGITTAAGYYQLGTPVPGLTQGFDNSAIDWEHSEVLVNNVEITEGIGGVRWGYEASPPRRTWETVARGDASKVRKAVENMLRSSSSISVRPVALVWDRDNLPATLAPVRWLGNIELENAGWRQATDGTWYVVGDMPMRLEEEL